jgi:N-acyl homoserine lactone hydrolase
MISGSPARLYLLPLSRTAVPLPAGKTLDMVSGCYLVAMSDGRHVLIDSGLPPESPPAVGQMTVLQHLAALDLRPADIDLLICTHFDIDHAGYHDAFPGAELIVQRRHYEVARSGAPRFAAARAHWDHPALRYRLVDGDEEIRPGLRVLETSGHAEGHQSVLLQLPRTGPVLLAVDAVVMSHLFTSERPAWPTDADEEQLRASTRKLLDLVEREGVALVVFGHDGRHWATLKTAPDYYD